MTDACRRVAANARRRLAANAFTKGHFASAYAAYIALWYDEHERDDLVWAGRSLERAQGWRANIAMWEEVARSLSAELAPPNVPEVVGEAGRLFDKLQLPLDYWVDPRGGDAPTGYYGKDEAKKNRHRRAWALHWAAEHASAAHRHELASQLHRAAAFAWAASSWGDRGTLEDNQAPKKSPRPGEPPPAAQARGDDARAGEENLSPKDLGAKWELAACEFFYSVMEGIEAHLRDRKDSIKQVYILEDRRFETYRGKVEFESLRGFTAGPAEVPLWLKSAKRARSLSSMLRSLSHAPSNLTRHLRTVRGRRMRTESKPNGTSATEPLLLSDTERMELCYRKWAEMRGVDDKGRSALTKACEALGAMEGALARAGRRGDAVEVHMTRQRLLRERERKLRHPMFVWLIVKRWVFGDGVRSRYPLVWAMALWIGVFPAIFARYHLVQSGNATGSSAASTSHSVLFGIGNALTITVGKLRTGGSVGFVVQILDTVSLYLLFGAVLYTLTRSFDD